MKQMIITDQFSNLWRYMHTAGVLHRVCSKQYLHA